MMWMVAHVLAAVAMNGRELVTLGWHTRRIVWFQHPLGRHKHNHDDDDGDKAKLDDCR